MYSEDDINSAVSAGALSAEAAESFRAYMSQRRALPRSSEENFRLINSFNDIFVAIGIVILLLAVGAIGQAIAGIFAPEPLYLNSLDMETYQSDRDFSQSMQAMLAGLFVAITAWPLAEFFTRKRRMALPSIILLLAFVGGFFATVFGAGAALGFAGKDELGAIVVIAAGLAAAMAGYVHWKRFEVPITVAAAVGVTVISGLLALLGIAQMEVDDPPALAAVLIAGLVIFALAMRWDISDRDRITRRSDVAFWLHLLAAPMIAHPIFALLGVTGNSVLGVSAAIGVLAVYVAFGLVALAIDRRALLVSALAYVLFALGFLFERFGAVELTFALTALVIGSALLSLSAFWQPIRRNVVEMLPQSVQDTLPVTQDLPLPGAATA
ncbi:MAG: hypothetical protein AAGL10_04840 [Pseudomonadota bacterium]